MVAQPSTSDRVSQTNEGSIQSSLGPYGDPFGIRATLARYGITFTETYILEELAILRGGQRRGAGLGGRLDSSLDIDLGRFIGWQGASVHADYFHIHDPRLSRTHVGSFATVSGLEALSSTRLFELWFEQRVFGDKFSLKVGQIAADTEFAVTPSAGVFLNAGFGWPSSYQSGLPSGGPAYPLATPGARVKWMPTSELTVRGGLFNGDPARKASGTNSEEGQRRNVSGTDFRTNAPALAIAEVSYGYGDQAGLPGVVTAGGWHHFGRFDRPSSRDARLPVADATPADSLRRFRGNQGLYGLVEQALYLEPGTRDRGLGAFVRLTYLPGDRNLIGFSLDAGIGYRGLFAHRPNDTIGLGVVFSRIGSAARTSDRDALREDRAYGSLAGIRRNETVIELTYQVEVVPGFTVQPDLQYILRPGGGRGPDGERVRNALVAGARTTINY